MSYQLNKSHLIICIVAALVITAGVVIHYLMGNPFTYFNMALWVSLIIVIFYFVGHIARHFLISSVFVLPEEEGLLDGEMESEAEMEVTEEALEGVMEYSSVEPEMIEYELTGDTFDDTDNEMYSEPTADELMERLAMGDVS